MSIYKNIIMFINSSYGIHIFEICGTARLLLKVSCILIENSTRGFAFGFTVDKYWIVC